MNLSPRITATHFRGHHIVKCIQKYISGYEHFIFYNTVIFRIYNTGHLHSNRLTVICSEHVMLILNLPYRTLETIPCSDYYTQAETLRKEF